ncbi:MAG: transglutaminase domain-containing protein [Desulfovibrio sp.]|nr:MAG: transglutaminase domain-containing protein [Desulfovibrio sp.]
MSAPPLLLAATLAFWGYMTGLWFQAVLMALLLEAPRVFDRRIRLDRTNVVRAADTSLVLFLMAATYLFLTPQPRQLYFMFQPRDLFFLVLGEWMPMCLFPLALVQRWGDKDSVLLADLFYFLKPMRFFSKLRLFRARQKTQPQAPLQAGARVNLDLPYLGVVVLAAGCADNRAQWYYFALALITGWALWSARPKRSAPWAFFTALAVAVAIGWPTQAALHQMQEMVRERSRDWPTDPLARSSSMGDIGELKLSHDVVLRLSLDQGPVTLPLLLREGTYNYYNGEQWMAMDAELLDVPEDTNFPHAWDLLDQTGPALAPESRITVYLTFTRRSGLLALPLGTTRIEGLPVGSLQRSTMGQVKAESTPGLAAYQAWFDSMAPWDAPPVRADIFIPEDDRAAVAQAALEAGLGDMAYTGAVAEADPALAQLQANVIRAYFAREFTYSLARDSRPESGQTSVLAHFLTHSRAGYCEHFATASVMLLRHVGIPARYVTGYAAHEYDPGRDLVLVRGNHGHAWVLYWDGERWRELDPTPPVWVASESAEAPLWQSLADFRSRAVFFFAKLRWLEQGKTIKTVLTWLLPPLILFLAFRLITRGKFRFTRRSKARQGDAPLPGADSPLFRVEEVLARRIGPRPQCRPLSGWILEHGGASLTRAAELHNRHRFDPQGLPSSDRKELHRLVDQWLARDQRSSRSAPGN